MTLKHSDEVIASIAKFAGSGMSASQIADQFENMTSGVVSGLAHRNKIKLNGRHSGGSKPGQAMAKPTYMQCEPDAVVKEVPTGLITFEQLKTNSCRFPLGDENFMFCGSTKLDGLPYCAHHCRICFSPR